jgi:hypothetical protein
MLRFTILFLIGLSVTPISTLQVSAADEQAPSDSAGVTEIGHSFARIMENNYPFRRVRFGQVTEGRTLA